MVNPSVILIRAMNSSLWIAVLVVHVGCIIEAQPSKSPVSSSSSSLPTLLSSVSSLPIDGEKRSHYSSFELIPAASQAAIYNRRQSFGTSNLEKRPYRGRKFSPTATTTSKMILATLSSTAKITENTNNDNDDDDDSCSRKSDGYYQNFGSGCSSYYFCAAGYQITYVCPPGEKFNGKKCDQDYECPKVPGHTNLCEGSPNGYYSNLKHPGRYYYCFHKAKVIDLQCDPGKVFVGDECTFTKEETQNESSTTNAVDVDNEDDESCTKKSNGFYVENTSECKKYYYCINGEKTELSCQSGFIFNGEICVHNSIYNCPTKVDKDKNNDNVSKEIKLKSRNGTTFLTSTLPPSTTSIGVINSKSTRSTG